MVYLLFLAKCIGCCTFLCFVINHQFFYNLFTLINRIFLLPLFMPEFILDGEKNNVLLDSHLMNT